LPAELPGATGREHQVGFRTGFRALLREDAEADPMPDGRD